MKYRIYRIWHFIRYIPHNIRIGIKNLIIWFPIIWNDRWWDYAFLLLILRKKLQLMEDGFRNKAACLHEDGRHEDQIEQCLLVLDRLIEDDYEYFKYGGGLKPKGPAQIDVDRLCSIIQKYLLMWWD